jgi:transcriptional regulator with XRE-family HTH domain
MPENSSEALESLLDSYDIGHKLRQLRSERKLALVDLGKHTGLSASMLSQLETGKMVPTLPTLARISIVFDVGLEFFFDNKSRQKLFSVVRADERLRFPERPGSPFPSYCFESLAFETQGKHLGAFRVEFPKREVEETTEHSHEGSEFIYVTEGSISVHYYQKDYVLRMGDSAYFDASESHSYRGLGKTGGTALVITLPPRI